MRLFIAATLLALTSAALAKPANIVLILTDDLDLMLGGMTPLAKTRKLMHGEGTHLTNWFCHTPVCCPSRAETLTGRYFHNIKVANAAAKGCMSVDTRAGGLDGPFYSEWYFAPHFANAGHKVGIFGKHLNNDNPQGAPPGVDTWFANGGGNYYNPTFSTNNGPVTFNNGTYADYSTSVIGNVSVAWIKDRLAADEPFFAYVAPKAPHIEDGPAWPVALAAPWYNDAFPGVKAPRPPSWNASCPSHHWIVRSQPPMTKQQAHKSDALYRSRWLSLLSVDDLVEAVVDVVDGTNTYVVFTSDHGYRFGQMRMPQGKWAVYDNDIRIPFYVRGPGVAGNFANASFPGTTADVMPTLLGLAGVATPASMDGRSVAPWLVQSTSESSEDEDAAKPEASWGRKDVLIEYIGLGNVVRYEHLEDTFNNTFRALRVVDPAAPKGQRNMMLAEFTDCRTNWNYEQPANEFELFDLDSDPHQLNNIYKEADPALRTRLHARLAKLYACRGKGGSAPCN